jgi:Sulfotransferase family
MDFRSMIFQAMFHIPSYARWLFHEANLTSTYRFIKRALKLLQWHCPPTNWRLKNPSHILFIDDLNTVFPDARFWMTHRDVADVIPSTTDLYFELHKAFTDHVDKVWLGEINIEFCELGMRRVLDFRDAGHDQRFFDVRFDDFQRDPFPSIEGLYRFLGEELTDETRARMAAWRNDTPRDKHGIRHYDPADYALDRNNLRARFAFYRQRFGL